MEIKVPISYRTLKKFKQKSPLELARGRYNDWRNHTKESKTYLCILFALSNGICPECGVDMILSFNKTANESGNAASLDHVKPLSETLIHDKLNLRIMCRSCNNGRHNKKSPLTESYPSDTLQETNLTE